MTMGASKNVKEEKNTTQENKVEKSSFAGSEEPNEQIVRRDEEGNENGELLEEKPEFDPKSLRMGDTVFYHYNNAVWPAVITSDGVFDGDRVNLCYLDGNTGRWSAEKKIARGVKGKEWWHDSKELAAAIALNRKLATIGPLP